MLLIPLSGLASSLSVSSALAANLGDVWQLKEGRTRRVSSVNSDPNSNFDFLRLKAGDTAEVCNIEGPGVITHIWITIRADDVNYNRHLILRVWWDDEETPSIEVPIGDFFAAGNAARADVDSTPIQVSADGKALNSFWPMPFRKRARVTVENQSAGLVDSFYYTIDYEERETLPKPLATFHGQYRQSYPVVDGQDYVFAEIEGRGQYVGTVLSWWSCEEGWPGEGDDRFYIDGEEQASIQGTGTEDYFSSAWGFRVVHRADHGVTVWDGTEEGSRCTAYRWHIHDPIRFEKSLLATIEHRGWAIRDGKWDGHAHRDDRFSSVALWYQTEPHAAFPALPAAAERMPYEERTIELEDALEKVTSGAVGRAPDRQEGRPWSGGAQIFFPAQSMEEAWMSVPFTVEEAGRWLVYLRSTESYDYGIWDIILDGETLVGERDMYSPTTRPVDIALGGRELEAGEHVLEVRTVGRNPEAKESGAYMGLDAILLRR